MTVLKFTEVFRPCATIVIILCVPAQVTDACKLMIVVQKHIYDNMPCKIGITLIMKVDVMYASFWLSGY